MCVRTDVLIMCILVLSTMASIPTPKVPWCVVVNNLEGSWNLGTLDFTTGKITLGAKLPFGEYGIMGDQIAAIDNEKGVMYIQPGEGPGEVPGVIFGVTVPDGKLLRNWTLPVGTERYGSNVLGYLFWDSGRNMLVTTTVDGATLVWLEPSTNTITKREFQPESPMTGVTVDAMLPQYPNRYFYAWQNDSCGPLCGPGGVAFVDVETGEIQSVQSDYNEHTIWYLVPYRDKFVCVSESATEVNYPLYYCEVDSSLNLTIYGQIHSSNAEQIEMFVDEDNGVLWVVLVEWNRTLLLSVDINSKGKILSQTVLTDPMLQFVSDYIQTPIKCA